MEQLDNLEKEAWGLKERFLKTVQPYRSSLWQYCRRLTGSAWDAEDLAQETLMRAFASLGQYWQPLHPKAYLFRIATNAWLNQQRKKTAETFPYEDDRYSSEEEAPAFRVHEAMDALLRRVTPRQAVIVLLMDVFSFTARETAELLPSSETAVKAALHRARARLHKLADQLTLLFFG